MHGLSRTPTTSQQPLAPLQLFSLIPLQQKSSLYRQICLCNRGTSIPKALDVEAKLLPLQLIASVAGMGSGGCGRKEKSLRQRNLLNFEFGGVCESRTQQVYQ
ncbi:Uncharacterized protein Adt_08341 [Abeliophyllum distichum]|uniref:Uncharacterized protein n=1 Tax=Abeliophyllum distichum TaxID=126358 RepID=A0ABD1VC96_9LAMI